MHSLQFILREKYSILCSYYLSCWDIIDKSRTHKEIRWYPVSIQSIDDITSMWQRWKTNNTESESGSLLILVFPKPTEIKKIRIKWTISTWKWMVFAILYLFAWSVAHVASSSTLSIDPEVIFVCILLDVQIITSITYYHCYCLSILSYYIYRFVRRT